MRINGKAGKGANTCANRKRTTPTKPEARLARRVADWNTDGSKYNGSGNPCMHRPGSLKK